MLKFVFKSRPQNLCCRVSRSFGLYESSRGFNNTALANVNLPGVTIVKTSTHAKKVLQILQKNKDRVHAWDTETIDIDPTEESAVGHGKIICATAFCGPDIDFGNGPRLYVDNFGSNTDLLMELKSYFEDGRIKKVWHNYSFDRHMFYNHGVNVLGFGGDTMHMARLADPSRGPKQYSLANVSRYYAAQIEDAKRGYIRHIEEQFPNDVEKIKALGIYKEYFLKDNVKHSMKKIFGSPKVLKDGTTGKTIVMPSILEMATQDENIEKWVNYATRDAEITFFLREVLASQLLELGTDFDGMKNMLDLYIKYWIPFGETLTDMEREGIKVSIEHLEKIKTAAEEDMTKFRGQFHAWLLSIQPGTSQFNIASVQQLQQLFFAPFSKKKEGASGSDGKSTAEEEQESKAEEEEEGEIDEEGDVIRKVTKREMTDFPLEKVFKVLNVNNELEEGKKKPLKHKDMIIKGLGIPPIDLTASGYPSVDTQVLKQLAGNPTKGDYGLAYKHFKEKLNDEEGGKKISLAINNLLEYRAVETLLQTFILPLISMGDENHRIHCSLNMNTETGRLSARRPNLQNQPALEKDKYKIRYAFQAEKGKKFIVADYGQLELRVLAIMTNCAEMIKAFNSGGDFHSRTALSMYDNIKKEIEDGSILLEWDTKKDGPPPKPLLKDKYAAERRKAKTMNFSIAYGKTAHGFAKDWNCSIEEARKSLEAWFKERPEVKSWQDNVKKIAIEKGWTQTLMGRYRNLTKFFRGEMRGHFNQGLRAAINTPIQGGAADIVIASMIKLHYNQQLKAMGWKLLLQIHDEEGPAESAPEALKIVKKIMEKPLDMEFPIALEVDAKIGDNWYEAK